MLQILRKSASGIIAKVLMGLLIISFGIWGIADVFRGFGSQTLATVGSSEITVPEFQRLYQQRLQQISQQVRRGFTPEEARALGIPDQILSERLADASLDEAARRMGLALSDEEIIKRVQANPAFFGPSGSFDGNYFAQLLRSNGFTEPAFLAAERGLAQRQQLIQSLAGGITVPKVLVDGIRRYETETRSISYVLVTPSNVGPFAEPTDEQLKTFFDARKVAFRAPEYRKINILALTPEALAAQEIVTDEQVKADYEAHIGNYGTPETRVVDQIVFPNVEEAKAAAEKLAAGTPFSEIAATRNLTAKDTSLGTVAKGDIIDPSVAEAAFALQANSSSGVTNGRFGPVIVHVGAIVPAVTKPLAEVADQIRQQLQIETARKAMLDTYDKLEDARAAGATLAESAAKFGLQLVTIDTDIQGKTPEDAAIPTIPARAEVLRGAFAAQVGDENDPVTLPQNGGYVWYEVAAVTPPKDRSFEEARSFVLQRWKEDEVAQALDAKVAELKKKIADGGAFDLTVTDAGLELRSANNLLRGRANDGVPQEALAAVFDTKDGAVGSASLGSGDNRMLFKVTRVTVPANAPENPQVLNTLRDGFQNDLMTEYLVQLQDDLGARINRAALDRVVGVSNEAVN